MNPSPIQSPSSATQSPPVSATLRIPYETPRLVSLPLAAVVAGASGGRVDVDGFSTQP